MGVRRELDGLVVLIEPKWDWNMCKVQEGKSRLLVLIEPKWDWNYGHEVAEGVFAAAVLIEPKWDWNGWPVARLARRLVRFNRTKVGLKHCRLLNGLDMSFRFNRTKVGLKLHRWRLWNSLRQRVLIEPKWDWNMASRAVPAPVRCVLIEPKWDWNTEWFKPLVQIVREF